MMSLNVFQIVILVGLLMGITSLAILLGSSKLRRESNLLLSLLIGAFVGNIGLYWLLDVGIISRSTMQILFIPWQMLIAPVFLLYVYSLKVFNTFPYRRWILFLPFFISLAVHLIIKLDIFSQGLQHWTQPNWVSKFYFIEEITSLLYCLISSIIVYRWISLEKRDSGFAGFGVNKEKVRWIKTMINMGLVLAVVWLVSLYFVQRSDFGFSGYYVLWILMAIVLNILGYTGIYFSIKDAQFEKISIPPSAIGKNTKALDLSTPMRYIDEGKIESLFKVAALFTKASSIKSLRITLKEWLQDEFSTMNVEYLDHHIRFQDPMITRVPLLSTKNTSEYLTIKVDNALKDDDLYFIEMAIQAYNFHIRRLKDKPGNKSFNTANKIFQSLVEVVENEELYKDPKLSLSVLAQKIGVSSGYLSKVINDAGRKNFNEFINDYRVEKAKEYMNDRAYDHYSIASYGLEAGFNSKSTFYKAFQKREGISPGKYQS